LRAVREEAWMNSFIGHELPPTKSPSQDVSDGKYAVSRRAVPQGPNPLHNR
jgi:hypothetical protein